MERIIKLLVLLVVIAVAWNYGQPWLSQFMGSGGSTSRADRVSDEDFAEEGDAADCILAALDAREAFGDIRLIGRSPEAAMTLRERLDQVLTKAEDLCQCTEDGCEPALEAVEIIDAAVGPLDNKARIASAALGAARAMEQVDRLLDRATAEAGS